MYVCGGKRGAGARARRSQMRRAGSLRGAFRSKPPSGPWEPSNRGTFSPSPTHSADSEHRASEPGGRRLAASKRRLVTKPTDARDRGGQGRGTVEQRQAALWPGAAGPQLRHTHERARTHCSRLRPTSAGPSESIPTPSVPRGLRHWSAALNRSRRLGTVAANRAVPGQIGDGRPVPRAVNRPVPGQIGDGRPVPVPGQIRDGDGDGDRGVRALNRDIPDAPVGHVAPGDGWRRAGVCVCAAAPAPAGRLLLVPWTRPPVSVRD